MSFQPPQRNPSLSPHRPLESNYWRASRSPGPGPNRLPGYGLSQSPGVTSNVGGFFSGERTLPMYKDKPYFAPRRTGPRLRRRRILYAGVCLVFVVFLWCYFVGYGLDVSRSKVATSDPGADLWKWIESLDAESEKDVDWDARREKVREVLMVSWDGYENHAWGRDEYYPVAKTGRDMIHGGMGWTIVDALDTLMIMNLTSRVQHARSWIQNSLQYDQDHDVSMFETTIRMLGGLLSAHYLSTTYPDLAPITDDDAGAAGEDLYIEKATDLADRLMGAFESASGVPYASVNLHDSKAIPSHADNGASSTAEATSLQLEFKYLAKLTGEAEFWRAAEKVMQVVDAQKAEDGLLPIFLYPETGDFKGEQIRLGSRGDSYYEYLIKQYLQTGEEIYKEMWDESLLGIRKNLITYSKDAHLTVLAELPSGISGPLYPKMDHLACFLPGSIALGATGGQPLSEAKKSPTWTQRQDEEILLSKELMKTCWATYLATKSGLAPEITYFKLDEPSVMEKDMYPDSTLTTGNRKSTGKDLPLKSKPLLPQGKGEDPAWKSDLNIHQQDRHNLQRPETVESLFYMYRITGDDTYRQWGWEMFKSFVRHTAVIEDDSDSPQSDPITAGSKKKNPNPRVVGFTSLNNADTIPTSKRDNMESFWMAETLKYMYLLFSERDFLPLEENIFNTEAHPMPRFVPGGELKTGWERARKIALMHMAIS
ncbi:mannosyl-oligosaccharide alpha-1,2-mannosidase [Aspergillus campestris IBT 28561]|uniref:alpha-1,2-Mannosidase n=1 Tax=Aspergillus campestris (strain IBT 28561) TaxID=1392248 RepID=A0A2I1D2F1_ASPC2|nr:mannosyl-oligosaccharide alpha-1,2-mannosidase [Aspergillus campestris IBT 28561]PKY04036.1 mannosyl-oligosaccharide alpha-1,2-mannosidase [Aspergillus campestris IBT 28561]